MPSTAKNTENIISKITAAIVESIEVDDDYLELVKRQPLRPIRDETEYESAIRMMLELAHKGDGNLTQGERDYFDVLNHYVGLYEDKHYPIETDHDPIGTLEFLMEEHKMKRADLGRVLGRTSAEASMILKGKRPLGKADVRKLAAHFHVKADLFA